MRPRRCAPASSLVAVAATLLLIALSHDGRYCALGGFVRASSAATDGSPATAAAAVTDDSGNNNHNHHAAVVIDDAQLEFAFASYVAKHSKTYVDDAERQMRRDIFAATDAFLQQENDRLKSTGATYILDHNEHSDWTPEELSQLRGLKRRSYDEFLMDSFQQVASDNEDDDWDDPAYRNERLLPIDNLPPRVDWRESNAITAIHNQGQCGSCWTFASSDALSAGYFLKSGDLLDFSEQELVDCVYPDDDSCDDGGYIFDGFEYWETHNADLAAEYPYVGKVHNCSYDALERQHKMRTGSFSNHVRIRVAEYLNVTRLSSDPLKAAVAVQPVVVALNANYTAFSYYRHGIFNPSSDDCENGWDDTDHAMLLIGYDTDADTGVEYYTLKNSWGKWWGEHGYMRMAITGDGGGVCGVQQEPVLLLDVECEGGGC